MTTLSELRRGLMRVKGPHRRILHAADYRHARFGTTVRQVSAWMRWRRGDLWLGDALEMRLWDQTLMDGLDD